MSERHPAARSVCRRRPLRLGLEHTLLLDPGPHRLPLIPVDGQCGPLSLGHGLTDSLLVELRQHEIDEIPPQILVIPRQGHLVGPQGRLVGQEFGFEHCMLPLAEAKLVVESDERLEHHAPPIKRPLGCSLGGQTALLVVIERGLEDRGKQGSFIEQPPHRISAPLHVLLKGMPLLLASRLVHVDFEPRVATANLVDLGDEPPQV